MAVQTAAGTILSISANTPATFNQAGYEASAVVFTVLGEVVNVPEHGRQYQIINHLPLATRTVRKFKGSRDDGTVDIQLARDSDDAGQIIAVAALDSDNDYSFRIAMPNGDKEYFQAKVTSYRVAMPGADSVIPATVGLAITANNAGVGIVTVNAP